MFGINVVKQGEQVNIWKPDGARRIQRGPKVLYAPFCKVEKLQPYVAMPEEYLVIRERNGRTEHRRGPVMEWLDPVMHESIEIRKALAVSANEAFVVYRELEGSVERRVERGPGMYVLHPNEWLHTFQWHGADPAKGNRKVPGALRFTKLRVIPDQMYFDVKEVRTSDEALLTIRLMIFFELVDVERMLDQTHDPVADFINALAADVICYVGDGTFEKFKEKTDGLNELEAYAQLTQRAERIGYRITKVVYRGYHANTTLQAMHDHAIETRTRLQLEGETEEQAQTLEDLKQTRYMERETRQQVQDAEVAEHKRTQQRLDHDELMRQAAEEKRIELEYQDKLYNQKRELWTALKELDADLTEVLVAEQRNPDKLIQFAGKDDVQLHMHEG